MKNKVNKSDRTNKTRRSSDSTDFSLFVLICSIVCLVSSTLGYASGQHNALLALEIEPAVDTDIYKTVAHVSLDSIDDLELLYTDTAKDVAYYRYTGERDVVKKDDVVYLYDGQPAIVLNTDVTGFYLELSENVYEGFSGTLVTDEDNNKIGYISSVTPNGIYCIWN